MYCQNNRPPESDIKKIFKDLNEVVKWKIKEFIYGSVIEEPKMSNSGRLRHVGLSETITRIVYESIFKSL